MTFVNFRSNLVALVLSQSLERLWGTLFGSVQRRGMEEDSPLMVREILGLDVVKSARKEVDVPLKRNEARYYKVAGLSVRP